MMMKTLESLLPKLFITLIPTEEGVQLYAELRKKAKLIKRFETQTLKSAESLEKKVRRLERESALSYISLLETEATQGLLSDCSRMEVADPSHFEKICIDDSWGIYMDKDGHYLTKQPEYETVWAHGGNCGIDDLDVVAQLDRMDDDFGLDTIEMGATIGVAMEGGLAAFGDAEAAINLVKEVGQGTTLGRILGNGAALLAVKRMSPV